ncbi:hypothetical protein LEP1GSC060_2982 [Leptospira weilii serovar Ranarum str. ICFT]|uniref:Uncharacterized protein n=1 Tax=Leptospira weilii serovar Ranarum str. ICFT TaxID=1218598 RepID=N1WJD2_9LEPT|nr:hypothetical protein [Leptospira weilii]EMY77447.1 hypothetical protein LEP1GSC060_2982 [Leptospira weilii serovar Ranarum str. ICFT]
MAKRRQQKIGGFAIFILGLSFTLWTWYTAIYEGYFYRKVSILFPMFCILGIGMILFTDYKSERIARGEDISQLSGHRLITPLWWTISAIAVLSGFVNYVFLSNWNF